MKTNLLALLEQLEDAVSEAPRIPMTDKVVVDGEFFLDLLEKIRFSLPDEVVRAKQIEDERDRLMTAGQQDAEKIIRQAEAYARKLIDEHEIINKAKAQAEQIVKEAQERAKDLTVGADEYVDRTLADISGLLQRTLAVIEKGRHKLRND